MIALSPPPFFDTNVLLYSISTDPAEAAKRERATALLLGGDGALSVQVLQEFYATGNPRDAGFASVPPRCGSI
jgi:predicted nucleic acid-binding protein